MKAGQAAFPLLLRSLLLSACGGGSRACMKAARRIIYYPESSSVRKKLPESEKYYRQEEAEDSHRKEGKAMLYDRDIREPLFDYLEETCGKLRILEEKTVGRSRADVLMVLPDCLCGIEIKSDADSYERLARQVRDYDKYFDRNIVAVGSRHALHAEEHVPEYWGIISVEILGDGVDFYMLRPPQANPKMKWKYKLKLLWRPELAQLQEWNGMPKYRQKSKAFVQEKILERLEQGKIEEETLRRQVSELLFERDYTVFDGEG